MAVGRGQGPAQAANPLNNEGRARTSNPRPSSHPGPHACLLHSSVRAGPAPGPTERSPPTPARLPPLFQAITHDEYVVYVSPRQPGAPKRCSRAEREARVMLTPRPERFDDPLTGVV